MARFTDVHDGFVGVTAEQLRAAHQRDLEVEAAEGVHFEPAWLDPQAGKVFWLSSGPSKEAVLRVHEKAGHTPRRSTSCRSRSTSPARHGWTPAAWPRAGQFRGEQSR
jgi:uncharacterized protein DUF4242